MGIIIKNETQNYRAEARRIVAAVPDGLLCYAVYGGTVDRSLRNLVGPDVVQLVNSGVDTVGEYHFASQYTGAKHLDTQITEPTEGTIIAVFAPGSTTAEARSVSTWRAPRAVDGTQSNAGVGLGFAVQEGALAIKGWAARTTPTGDSASHSTFVAAATPLAVGKMVAAAVSWGGSSRELVVDFLTEGTQAVSVLPGTTNWDPTTGTFRVGSDYTTPYTMTHGATLIYNRRLSDQEKAAAYAQLKKYFADGGVVI